MDAKAARLIAGRSHDTTLARAPDGDWLGRQYRSRKRHLTARGLTPEQYRAKWGLRPDYPMVAPSYSKARSELAKALGLGQKAAGRKRKAGKKG